MKRNISLLIALFFLMGSYLQGQIDDKNLIAHFKFDDSPNDLSQHKNHGTISGNVVATQNRYGTDCTAYAFDGSTGYIRVANNQTLAKIKQTLSITVWAKQSSFSCDNPWFTICCKADERREDYDSPHFRLQLSEKQASLNTYFTNGWSQQFIPDKWYFFAVTVSTKSVKVYVDGKLMLNTVLDEPLESNNNDLLIGRDKPGADEFFCGAMDDLRLYNKSLSAAEVNILYNDNSEKNMISPCFTPVKIPPVVITDTIRKAPVIIADTIRSPTVVIADTITSPTVVIQDTVRVVINDTTIVKDNTNDYSALPKETAGTKVVYQQTIKVSSPNIIIIPYDDKKQDGDIVSININDEWVTHKYTLKSKKYVRKNEFIHFTLNKGENNYLISRAWNLGRIPDNTLAIDIDDGINPVQKIKIYSKIGISGGIKIIYEPPGK